MPSTSTPPIHARSVAGSRRCRLYRILWRRFDSRRHGRDQSRVGAHLAEAQTQTFADAFLVLALCLAFATAMVPLLRKAAPSKAPTADAH